eukprot:m.34979 g.34979  ORF g.34979 m.34979 type:complete len:608 (-) comp17064_c0_seq1:343-2166(-)
MSAIVFAMLWTRLRHPIVAICMLFHARHVGSDFTPTLSSLVFGEQFCTCNLSPGSCDPNCCCDTECNCNDILAFEVNCDCTQKESFWLSCDSNRRKGIHTAWGNFLSSAEFGAFQSAPTILCVERETTPVVGKFFTPYETNVSLDIPALKSKLRSEGLSFEQSNASQSTPSFEDHVVALPYPLFGECSELSFTSVNSPLQYVCTRPLGRQHCGTNHALNARAYVPKTDSTSANHSIFAIYAHTGEQVFFTDDDNYTGLSNLNAYIVENSSVCTNVVVAVDVRLTWTASGITHIVSKVYLGTAPATETMSSSVPLLQSFSVSFTNMSLTALDQVEYLPRGGNPGYVVNGIVLDAASKTPLTLVATTRGDGTCAAATTQPLLFGIDIISGCVLQVTAANCDALRAAAQQVLQTSSIGTLDNESVVRAYGNEFDSDTSVVEQHMYEDNVNLEGPRAVVCAGVLTQVQLTVVSANQGRVLSPQQRIVGARVVKIFSDIALKADTDTTLQNIQLYQSAQFVSVPDDVALQWPQEDDGLLGYLGRHGSGGCNGTTCYSHTFYPLRAAWDTTVLYDEEHNRAVVTMLGLLCFCSLSTVAVVFMSRLCEPNYIPA